MDFIDIDETLLLRTVYENDICNTWVEALNNKNHMKWSRQRHLTHSIVSIRNYIDDLKKEIHELNIKIDKLEQKVEELMDENKKLKTNI